MTAWFFCIRCKEEGVQRAKHKAMADSLRAQPLARVMQSAKALCGWMRRRCRHGSQCHEAEPTEVVLQAYEADNGSVMAPQSTSSPADIEAICERMREATKDSRHCEAVDAFDAAQEERRNREIENAERRRIANDQERTDKARERQRREWDRNWSQGLRPVATNPGRPIDVSTYDMLLAGRPYAPAYGMVLGFGENAVRAAMDAWSKPNMSRQQQFRLFFNIARRIQRGFGVSWMGQSDIERNGLTALNWDDKRGPFYSQGGEYETDLPVEMYDGGDSRGWENKQREAEASMRGRDRQDAQRPRTSISELLGSIGRTIDFK